MRLSYTDSGVLGGVVGVLGVLLGVLCAET